MPPIFNAFTQLLKTWWHQDRIRVNRCCGQLLTLSVGDRMVIDDQIFIVVNRWPEREQFHLVPQNQEPHHASRNISHTALTSDTAEVRSNRTLTEHRYSSASQAHAVPCGVEYRLQAWTEEDEAPSAQESIGQATRLIVPIANQSPIQLIQSQLPRELLPEEIMILPRVE